MRGAGDREEDYGFTVIADLKKIKNYYYEDQLQLVLIFLPVLFSLLFILSCHLKRAEINTIFRDIK